MSVEQKPSYSGSLQEVVAGLQGGHLEVIGTPLLSEDLKRIKNLVETGRVSVSDFFLPY